MKKAFIIFIGIFFFSCSSDNTTHDTATDTDTRTETMDESVEIGSGEEVSPQLDMQDDTSVFDVDTVTTPRPRGQ